jgi:non-ribosomal peptide synthetase component F
VLDEQLAYWRQQLGGAVPLILPVDRQSPLEAGIEGHAGALDVEGATIVASIPSGVSDAVRALGRRYDTTPFITLLAAFQVMLHRWTGHEDVVVGTSIAGRDRVECEGLIGFFINMLPLRVPFHDRPSFVDLLARVREAALGAYTHQQLPFAWLVQELGLSGQDAHIPMFQVVFCMQNTSGRGFDVPDLQIQSFGPTFTGPRLPLSVWIFETGEGLLSEWTYDPRVFTATTIERLHTRYNRLLERIVAQPEARVHELDRLSEDESVLLDENRRELKDASRRKFMNQRHAAGSLRAV